MSYLPIESNVQEAVKEVKRLYKDNKWGFSYCVGLVAQRYKLDFTFLLSKCHNKHANAFNPIMPNKPKRKTLEEIYGRKIPYWIEK
jgi:hypothetical protein